MRFWNDHRNFILAVASGLLAVLLVESWALGVLADAAAMREANHDLAAFVEDQSEQVQDEEVLEEGRGIALREHVLPQHRQRYEYAVAERFVLPADDPNPLFRLRKALESVADELRERARPADVKLPKGLGFPEDLRDTDAAEGLVRLSAAGEAIRRAIDSRMTTIDEVRHEKATVRSLGDGQALQALRIRIVLRGDWAATTRWLAALSGEAPTIAVLDADLRTVEGAVRAEVALAALRVVQAKEDGPAGAETAPGTGTQEGAPTGPKPIRTYRPR